MTQPYKVENPRSSSTSYKTTLDLSLPKNPCPRLSWAAGLFIGEGTIGSYGRGLTLAISMQDKNAIESFAAVVESYVGERVGNGPYKGKVGVYVRSFNIKGKDCWQVVLNDNPARPVAIALYPYLKNTEKGRQFREAFKKRKWFLA